MIQVSSRFYTEVIQTHIDKHIEVLDVKSVPGGSINYAQRVSTIKGDCFIKWNPDAATDFFEKEARGLDFLRKTKIISIPSVLGYGTAENIPYLVLEYIHSGKRSSNFWKDFGTKLAQLHMVTQQDFGLDFDNYIGALPQKNTYKPDWAGFFIENRLKAQVKLAKNKKLVTGDLESKFETLYEKIPNLLLSEPAALIHGDLWTGNVMTDSKGLVCLMDPAVHFAHREIEIAFTRLFGGFDDEFYKAYQSAFPLEKGFEKRAEIYNLYPLLVHLNLFGKDYLKPVESTLKKFI